MKVPVRWLNEYVKVDDIEPKKLSEMFLSIGFEVEEIINPSEAYVNIVTGKILDLTKHPNADSLDIVRLSVGDNDERTIVTGAKNISIGDVVPVALEGAVVSGGKQIRSSELRGIFSEGMLCSGKELDIDDNTIEGAEVDGILILPRETKVGMPIGKALDLDEYIFDISVSSNRPDCNSILGLAKEISVKLNRQFKMPDLTYKTISSPKNLNMPKSINIEDLSVCSRYHGNVITDITLGVSPQLMRRRLLAVGLRPINVVVDITNYVLMEVGQPLHAFDLDKVEGDIYIRHAKKGERLIALNDTEYALEQSMLVIADSSTALAIAGVMGGKQSAISDTSANVFLETARFSKLSVRSTSRMLGLRSDSSARFERGVDYDSVDVGRLRALNLFDSLKVGKILDVCLGAEIEPPAKKVICSSYKKINSLLGIDIEKSTIKTILNQLGFEISDNAGDDFECIVPLSREDVDNYTDLAEEVIRFYGYDNLNSTNMESSTLTRGELPQSVVGARRVRETLKGAGLFEIINFSFIGGGEIDRLNLSSDDKRRTQIKISNPLGEDRAFMRTQLVSSMVRTLQLNKSRQNDNIGLFELAKVFIADELPLKQLPQEPYVLCVGLAGAKYDFYYLKNIIKNLMDEFSITPSIIRSDEGWLHSGISADIIVDAKKVGSFGKIHPKVAASFNAPEDIYILELMVDDIMSRPPNLVRVKPLPKYPAVDRDLAVVVRDSVTAGEMISAIESVAKGIIETIQLFDVYYGGQIEKGYKSMAFSIRLRSAEKTLQESETQTVMSKIIQRLDNDFGAKLR